MFPGEATNDSLDSQRRSMQMNRQLLTVALAGVLTAGGATAKPLLILDVSQHATEGSQVIVPVAFTFIDITITALVFSLDVDGDRLRFDPTDDDMDGIPDAVTLPAGLPSVTLIGHDPDDPDGEIDFMLVNLSGAALPRGIILEITLDAVDSGSVASWVRFSDDPTPSFGDAQGDNVDGRIGVIGSEIFADSFESGDTSAWSRSEP